jgi:hypothetical protein
MKQTTTTLELDLESMIDKALEKFNMKNADIMNVPMFASTRLSQADCPTTEEARRTMQQKPYRELIGTLLYLAQTIFFEISFSVSKLSEFLNDPGINHWTAAKNVLRYLKGVKDRKFNFKKSTDLKNAWTVFGFVDADWAGNLDNRKSKAGYLFKLGNNIISFATRNEEVVALSTAEAELMAATIAARELVWIRRLMKEIGHEQKNPTILFEDNMACIKMSRNPEYHQRTKHIDIKYFYCREKYLNGELRLVHCNSKDMQADLLTKPLPFEQFHHLLQKCFGSKN